MTTSTGVAMPASDSRSEPTADASHDPGSAAETRDSVALDLFNWIAARSGWFAPAGPRAGVRRRITRTVVVVTLDFLVITGTLALCLALFQIERIGRVGMQPHFILMFSAVASGCFLLSGLYKRNWRFVTLADCGLLFLTVCFGLAVTWVLTLGIPVLANQATVVAPLALVHLSLATIVMQSMRLARRSLREIVVQRAWQKDAGASAQASRKALLIGHPEWAVSVIELIKSDANARTSVVGVLLPHGEDTITQLRGVPVLGTHEVLDQSLAMLTDRGRRPDRIIVCDDGVHLSAKDLARLTSRVRELGLELTRLADPFAQLLQRGGRSDPDDLPLTELLGRNEFKLNGGAVSRQIAGHCVLVTGAGGTIGGELVWQLASFRPSSLVLLDHCEFNLYSIEMRLRERYPDLEIHPELCCIRDATEVRRVFARHHPTIVYHAAALKHVPMVELNPCAGAYTNIIGTSNVANAVCEYSARAMIQVSTDKAVNPIGMMGATKRVGELYCQSLDLCGGDDQDTPRFMTVRFGNVLGSSGSVVPLFKRQLLEGRPLTITHPDIERFFMTVREAVHLILQSSSRALEEKTSRGTIFVLDMGAPVKILDLARRMIRLHGLEPDRDVPIQFVGLRPGEKLYEELFDSCETEMDSGIQGLFEARSNPIPLPLITRAIDRLAAAVQVGDQTETREITHNLIALPNSGVDMTSLFSKSSLPRRPSSTKMIQEV